MDLVRWQQPPENDKNVSHLLLVTKQAWHPCAKVGLFRSKVTLKTQIWSQKDLARKLLIGKGPKDSFFVFLL